MSRDRFINKNSGLMESIINGLMKKIVRLCAMCNIAIKRNAFHIRKHSLSNQYRKNVMSIANTTTVKKTLSNSNKIFKIIHLVNEIEAKTFSTYAKEICLSK